MRELLLHVHTILLEKRQKKKKKKNSVVDQIANATHLSVRDFGLCKYTVNEANRTV
jgi:hypothetical protein